MYLHHLYQKNKKLLYDNLKRYSLSSKNQLVVGCGSNVVDYFMRVRKIPKSGDKSYFASPTKIMEAVIVGGVTLNHLAWASLLNVPTGLMTLQGNDENGVLIREAMQQCQISTKYVQVSDEYVSSASYVWLTPDGERCILMAKGSSATISPEIVDQYFMDAIEQAPIVTTEISQINCDAVKSILNKCKNKKTSILDVDVPPSIATTAAELCTSIDMVKECVSLATVVKPSVEAARELLSSPPSNIADLAKALCLEYGNQMVAVTDGSRGCALASPNSQLYLEAAPVNNVIDATGAGDAFLGGLIASIYYHGVPSTEEELKICGSIASATGAACVSNLGALPPTTNENKKSIETYLDIISSLLPTNINNQNSSIYDSLHSDMLVIQQILKNQNTMEQIDKVANNLVNNKGHIYCSAIGKSTAAAKRLSASLASLSLASHFVHATEWAHGDMGQINSNDVVIFFSNSGKTPEIIHAMQLLKERCTENIIIISGNKNTPCHKLCKYEIHISLEPQNELLNVIPTRSVVLQEAVCNAILASIISKLDQDHNTIREKFLYNHPGGGIGLKNHK